MNVCDVLRQHPADQSGNIVISIAELQSCLVAARTAGVEAERVRVKSMLDKHPARRRGSKLPTHTV